MNIETQRPASLAAAHGSATRVRKFASHDIGERVEFNTGLIGGTPQMKTGVITEIDDHGTARIQRDDGETSHRDLCALRKLPNKQICEPDQMPYDSK